MHGARCTSIHEARLGGHARAAALVLRCNIVHMHICGTAHSATRPRATLPQPKLQHCAHTQPDMHSDCAGVMSMASAPQCARQALLKLTHGTAGLLVRTSPPATLSLARSGVCCAERACVILSSYGCTASTDAGAWHWCTQALRSVQLHCARMATVLHRVLRVVCGHQYFSEAMSTESL